MFIAGCVNPSRVVSVDPPLVAALTDLTKGANPTKWNYIKVLRQPLSSMTGGPPQLGQQLSTIAYYEQSDNPEHWNDFHPTVVNCVTWKQLEIDRILTILPESEWRDLDAGLRQLPVPPPVGLYKVEIDLPQRHTALSRQELTDWIDLYLSAPPSESCCKTLQNSTAPHLISAANGIEPSIGGHDVLAVITAPDQSAGQHGLIVSTPGLYYRFGDSLRGMIPWTSMWGAGYASDGLEIVLRSGSRVRLGHRLGDVSRVLEQLFDGIAKSREPVPQ
jgi:hypothetical protein